MSSDSQRAAHASSSSSILATCLASELAGKFDVHPRYMEVIQGADIKKDYRKKVIVWVKKLADLFKLSPECVAATVQYLDRFLSLVRCRPGQLQVAALACLLLANKYIDLGRVGIRHLCRLFERVIPSEHVRSAELMILMKLKWETHAFTPYSCIHLLRTLDAEERFSEDVWATAAKLVDHAMLHYEYVPYRPSAVAAAALRVSSQHHGVALSSVEGFLAVHAVDFALPDALTSSLQTHLTLAHCVSPVPLGDGAAAGAAGRAAGGKGVSKELDDTVRAEPSTPPSARVAVVEGSFSQDSSASTHRGVGGCHQQPGEHGQAAGASGPTETDGSAECTAMSGAATDCKGAAGTVVGDCTQASENRRSIRVPARHVVASSACFKATHVDEGADCSAIASAPMEAGADARSTAEFSADIERDRAHSEPSQEFAAMVAVGGGL